MRKENTNIRFCLLFIFKQTFSIDLLIFIIKIK